MEIHSSSLASFPANYNTKKSEDKSVLLNNNNAGKPDNRLLLNPPSMSTVVDNFDSVDLQQLSNNIGRQKKTLNNSHSHRSLNAYIQENIQPLKNQRSALISGIDIFA